MNFKHRTPFKRETKGTKTIVGQNMLHYKSDIEAHTTFLAQSYLSKYRKRINFKNSYLNLVITMSISLTCVLFHN